MVCAEILINKLVKNPTYPLTVIPAKAGILKMDSL